MTRRGWFATIMGAVAARFAPKPAVQMLGLEDAVLEDAAERLGYRVAMYMDIKMRQAVDGLPTKASNTRMQTT